VFEGAFNQEHRETVRACAQGDGEFGHVVRRFGAEARDGLDEL
jgi:hypothetical protein